MNDIPSDSLISVDRAIIILDAVAVHPQIERLSITDAGGRVLADALIADRDAPAFDKSLVDGYALHAADAPGPLRDLGEIAAGAPAGVSVSAGECIAIMTGAPVPAGADAVCPVESTRADGSAIAINQLIKPGQFIEPRGTHWKQGDIVLPTHTALSPAGLAVAASVGAAMVKVFSRPRVGVLTTGDEVVPFDQTPGPSQLRDGNSILITGLLRRTGCEPVSLGHALDDPVMIGDRLRATGLDAICVTGGMSMGRHDHVPNVLRELGYELKITKLRMRPGKPFVFAEKPGAPPVFGLPGNPVSGFVCVVRLASRLLLRMQGRPPEPRWATATLHADLPANGPREFYQPAVAERGTLQPLTWRGSADVLTLARANALIRRPADAPFVPAGQSTEFFDLL